MVVYHFTDYLITGSISGLFKMYNNLNEWREITNQFLHHYLNYSIYECENEISVILRSVGNVPLTLGLLAFITLLYMLDLLQTCGNECSDDEDADTSNTQSCDSHLPSDIINEIHRSASRLCRKKDEVRCIQLLKKCPEAINTPKPPYMFTPFLKACSYGNSEAVIYMIQKGADIRAQTKDGETPLFLALWNLMKRVDGWDPRCIEILYRAGCDVNVAKRHGYTPLHAAAKSGNVEAVKWLLEHGANPYSLTRCNMKPIDYANEKGHAEIAKLLEDYS